MRTTISITLIAFFISCCNNSESLNAKQVSDVRDSVQQLATSFVKDVSNEGPVAWLRYFENAPGFFMASEGQLVFPDNDSAKNFINNILIKRIRKINLKWSNIRIDPLTKTIASIAAKFHETITDFAGRELPQDGYFTGIAQQTTQGWKLLNVHWSIIKTH